MLNLEAALGRKTYEALMRGIARGRYQVLLGAGASASSKDRWGSALPGGDVLREDIVANFSLPTDEVASLKRAYQLAKTRVSSSGEAIGRYIEQRFTDTQPAEWYDKFLQLQWAGLWSLNVDDCVERAAHRSAPTARQKLKSVSWTEKHSNAQNDVDQLLLVHLHGKASRAKRTNELIFDISAYVHAFTSQHRWLKVFGDEFPVAPFLVIGATLQEEIELQTVFEEGRASASEEHPSIIILRDISDFQRAEYESYGLAPLAWTAEDFIDTVLANLPSFLSEIAPKEVLQSVGSNPKTFRFLAHWKPLSSDSVQIKDNRHDLYRGHEPRWSDAVRSLISRRASIKPLVDSLTRSLSPGKHSVQVLTGETFSGKSSILMKACRELETAGFTPYLFDQEAAIDIDAVFHWVQRVPRSVLVIDDASDFARDLATLLTDPRSDVLSLRIVLTTRLSRSQHIKNELVSHHHDTVTVPSSLTSNEVTDLLNLLAAEKRLGSITQLDARQRREYFDGHGRKLFSAMAELEDGRGFKTRVVDEFDRVGSQESRRLLAVTGLANRLGYSLPLRVTKTAAGLTARETEQLVEANLSDLLVVEKGHVTGQHKVFGELLIGYLSLDEKAGAIINLALAVAPHLSPAAISASTIYYRIARSLMGHEMLLRLLEDNYEAVLEVFEKIEWAYEWNARFWDQRALVAADNRRFEEAFSWAQQALDKRKDAFSLNTIGSVLMRRAVFEGRTGHWPTETYEKAHGYLLEARQLEKERADYPIETFFSFTRRLLEQVPVRDRGLNMQIANFWANWYAALLLVDEATKTRLHRTQMEAADAWIKHGLDEYR